MQNDLEPLDVTASFVNVPCGCLFFLVFQKTRSKWQKIVSVVHSVDWEFVSSLKLGVASDYQV